MRAQGYALYDMVVMRIHGREPPSMWAHHAAEALGCFLMTCFRQAAFFPTMFAITEVTVLPGNLLWLAQKFVRDEKSKIIPALLLARFVAFAIFRAFILPHTLNYAIQRGNFVQNVRETHPVVSVLSAANMVRSRGTATRTPPAARSRPTLRVRACGPSPC